MAETTELDILLSSSGGASAAADLKLPADAINNLKQGHEDLQSAFSKRFSSVALDIYARDALRSAGLSDGLRKVVGTLDYAMMSLGNAVGFASSSMGIWLAAGAALAVVASKIYEGQKQLATATDEATKINEHHSDSYADLKTGLDAYLKVHGTAPKAFQDYVNALKEVEAEEKRANELRLTTEIATLKAALTEQDKLKTSLTAQATALQAQKKFLDDSTKSLEHHGVYSEAAANTVQDMALSNFLNTRSLKENKTALDEAGKKYDEFKLKLKEAKVELQGITNDFKGQAKAAEDAGKTIDTYTTKLYSDLKKKLADMDKEYKKEDESRLSMEKHHYELAKAGNAAALNDELSKYRDMKAEQGTLDDEDEKHYEELQKLRASNFASTMSTLSSLSSSSNKTLHEIGKAAALADAYINVSKAATVALGAAPPPLNFALRAAVVAAGAINIAEIASHATGTDQLVGKETLMRVGENGPERVTVTPLGAGGRPVTQSWTNNNQNSSTSIGAIHLHVTGSGNAGKDFEKAYRLLIARIRGGGDLGMVRT